MLHYFLHRKNYLMFPKYLRITPNKRKINFQDKFAQILETVYSTNFQKRNKKIKVYKKIKIINK